MPLDSPLLILLRRPRLPHLAEIPLNRYRWAWFALACLVVAGWAWTSRYEYRECNRGGCIAVNRWTGEHHRTDEAGAAERRKIAEQGERSRDSLAVLGMDTMAVGSIPAPGDYLESNRWSKYSDQEKIRRFREAHGLDTMMLSADAVRGAFPVDTVFARIAAEYSEAASPDGHPGDP